MALSERGPPDREALITAVTTGAIQQDPFEALRMEPAVVYVPGHAFVAVRLGPPGTSHHGFYDVIETTMVSGGDFAAAQRSASANWDKQQWRSIVDVSRARKLGFMPFPL